MSSHVCPFRNKMINIYEFAILDENNHPHSKVFNLRAHSSLMKTIIVCFRTLVHS